MNKQLLKLFDKRPVCTSNISCGWLHLIDTEYLASRDGKFWVNINNRKFMSFEEVLNSSPICVQTQLLFHLDYFVDGNK
jgi:hypothetical protein